MKIKMKYYQLKYSIFTLAMLASFGAQAGNVASTFNPGDTLTATQMTEIKGAVNDNDSRMSGVEFIGSVISIRVTSAPSTLLSVVVTAPSNGFAIVNFSSTVRIDHVVGTTDSSRLWISTDPSSVNTFDETWRLYQVLSAEVSGLHWGSIQSQAVFPVTAGTTSFFARADGGVTGATYRNTSMNAIFVPNRY